MVDGCILEAEETGNYKPRQTAQHKAKRAPKKLQKRRESNQNVSSERVPDLAGDGRDDRSNRSLRTWNAVQLPFD